MKIHNKNYLVVTAYYDDSHWEILPVQKYRLYLSRLQREKENDSKSSFGGLKHPDAPPKEPPGSFSLQNSTNTHKNDVANGSYRFPGNSLLPRSVNHSSLEDDLKEIVSEPVTEPERASSINLVDSHKAKSTQTSFNHCFKALESDVTFEAFGSTITTKYSWGEAPEIQFRQDHKPLLHLQNSFNKLPLPDPLPQVHVDPIQSITSISTKPSTAERGPSAPIKGTKPLYPEYGISHLSPNVSSIESLPITSKCHMVNHQAIEPIYTTTSSMTVQASHLSWTADLEAYQRSPFTFGSGSSLAAFGDDLQFFLQGDYNGDFLGVRNVGFPDLPDLGLASDIPIHLYDSLRFGFEYPYDPTTEYATIDQSLLT